MYKNNVILLSSAEKIQKKALVNWFQKLSMVEKENYQSVLYVTLKNQDLLMIYRWY